MPYGADHSSQAWRLQPTPRGTADLSRDREWFAEALMVERIHGDTAFVFIAERISLLATVGDLAGVERWMAIADRARRRNRCRNRCCQRARRPSRNIER